MKYARTLLQDIEGYVPGEQPKAPGVIKLNTNENPYPPSPMALEALRGVEADALRKYPDPLSVSLRARWAEIQGYAGPEWVIAGNGMDELLALAVRTFVDPGDTILTTCPTYTLYDTLARLHGARVDSVELDEEYQLPEAFFERRARLCFLPRPNAPTGVCVPREAVERLCRGFDGIVVIDEAYVDFSENDCMDFAKRHENAVVMRTFSKSFSLAGLRLGLGVANPIIIAEFLKTKDSYNLNAVTQAVGIAALSDYEYMKQNAGRVVQTRERASEALRKLGFTVTPSQSNFVLARWNGSPDARTIFERIKERKIYVRYFDAPRLRDALRITIGTDAEMDALLEALRDIVQ